MRFIKIHELLFNHRQAHATAQGLVQLAQMMVVVAVIAFIADKPNIFLVVKEAIAIGVVSITSAVCLAFKYKD